MSQWICTVLCAVYTDIDECENKTICENNARCINTEGSFFCECVDGFNRDGTVCISELIERDRDCLQTSAIDHSLLHVC